MTETPRRPASERQWILAVMDSWVRHRSDRWGEYHVKPSKLKAKNYDTVGKKFELPEDEVIADDRVARHYHDVETTIARNFPGYQHAPLRYFLNERHANFVIDSRSLISMEARGYRRMLDDPDEAMYEFYCHLLRKMKPNV